MLRSCLMVLPNVCSLALGKLSGPQALRGAGITAARSHQALRLKHIACRIRDRERRLLPPLDCGSEGKRGRRLRLPVAACEEQRRRRVCTATFFRGIEVNTWARTSAESTIPLPYIRHRISGGLRIAENILSFKTGNMMVPMPTALRIHKDNCFPIKNI